jgi:tRNA pseudouridine38-40 synthase
VSALPPVSFVIEYDGTDFVGWQVQPNGRSVQQVVEEALGVICTQPVRVTAAGRTDSGVHAVGQVVSFIPPIERPLVAFEKGLNCLLPHDVAVREVRVRLPGFDARRSAQGKLYRYRISNLPIRSPLRARQAWQVFQKLDVDAMRRAATCLVGRHDFAAFQGANCEAKTTVRTMRRVDIGGQAGGEVTVEVEATAFLKHMVRNLVGTLVEVGLGKRLEADVPRILASRERTQAGRTAPPQGLCLVEVFYPADGHERPPLDEGE